VIVSRRWLEALLGRPLDARAVAEQVTMHAAAVDAVVPLHQDLGDVVIGRVLEGPARVLVDGAEWHRYAGWQSFSR